MSLLAKYADRIQEDAGCLRWTGYAQRNTPFAKIGSVRRALWVERYGPIKAGAVVRCTCETALCVNIEHCCCITKPDLMRALLKDGAFHTPLSNARRSATLRKMRSPLTLEAAREIRQSTEHWSALAQRYGVGKTTINDIRRGTKWRDHSGPFAGLGA